MLRLLVGRDERTCSHWLTIESDQIGPVVACSSDHRQVKAGAVNERKGCNSLNDLQESFFPYLVNPSAFQVSPLPSPNSSS